MKLLIATSSAPDKGQGINAYVRELSTALIELGHDLHLLSPPPGDYAWLERNGISHVRGDQFDDPIETIREIYRYIHDTGIDGVINNDNAYLQSLLPALQCPAIVVGHMASGSIASLACYQHSWADHVVSISSDMQRVFVRKFGVPSVKCPIIFGGVSDPGTNERRFVCSDEMRIVFAGGFSKNKGAHLVMRAVESGGDCWRGTTLDWYGTVPERIRTKLKRFDHVRMHGRVPRAEFLGALSDSDVLLFPSKTEGCPMVILESMSHGVVPITSNGKGAMRWMVNNGQEGFVCHLDDWPRQMLQCLDYLKKQPEGLKKMKESAYSGFKRNFRSTAAAETIVGLLQRPTVNRIRPTRRIIALRWHRPFRPDGLKAPLIDRIAIRSGWLRKAGVVEL